MCVMLCNSVPGHHVFNNLQGSFNPVLFHSVPKTLLAGVCLTSFWNTSSNTLATRRSDRYWHGAKASERLTSLGFAGTCTSRAPIETRCIHNTALPEVGPGSDLSVLLHSRKKETRACSALPPRPRSAAATAPATAEAAWLGTPARLRRSPNRHQASPPAFPRPARRRSPGGVRCGVSLAVGSPGPRCKAAGLDVA